jgi:hypothetical protein
MKERCYIKISPDEVEIVGDENEVLALYGTLTHELLGIGISAANLKMAFDLSIVPENEMDKKAKDIIKERTDKSKQQLLETFKKLLFEEE